MQQHPAAGRHRRPQKDVGKRRQRRAPNGDNERNPERGAPAGSVVFGLPSTDCGGTALYTSAAVTISETGTASTVIVLDNVRMSEPTPPTKRPVGRAALFLLVVVAVSWAARAHSATGGGDPGGTRRRVANQILVALPQGAQVSQDSDGTSRMSSCDGRPGTQGWSDIVVAYRFTVAVPPASVLEGASAAMARAHWTSAGRLHSPLGDGLTWTKPVISGVSARATLAPGTRGPGQPPYWDLTAVVPPAGTAASGC